MIFKGHGCSSKCLIGFGMRTYLFRWKMGGRLDLPRPYVGELLEVGVQRVSGWLFKKPSERSNLHHMRRGHGLVLLLIPKAV